MQFSMYFPNKKVLLRERKRHTTRHISSTPYSVPYRGIPHPWLGGTPSWVPPILTWPGGTPSLDGGVGYPILGYPPLFWPGQEVPHPWAGGREYPILGYPHLGVPSPPSWPDPPPHPGMGHPPRRELGPVIGVPPGKDLGPVTGVPPRKDMGPVEVLWDGDGVPPGCELTNKLKLLPSPSSGCWR